MTATGGTANRRPDMTGGGFDIGKRQRSFVIDADLPGTCCPIAGQVADLPGSKVGRRPAPQNFGGLFASLGFCCYQFENPLLAHVQQTSLPRQQSAVNEDDA